jgi:hypothetical protein
VIHNAPWWENRIFIAALVILSAAPLFYPQVPPLVDLFGHMGRYRVELDINRSPWLPRYYGFHWAAIGNIGVDVLILPLGRLLGLEPAVKLIVMLIPPMTVAGFLWVAQEVHGRVPPTVLFALPFALGYPFLFGFVNFALSMALAFLAFGFWLHLAHRDRLWLRAVLFVPISVIIFFCHTYGWGALGLLCFSAEAVRQHDSGRRWLKAGFFAAIHASVMTLPILVMLAWRSETHGGKTAAWWDWHEKWIAIYSALRDRWYWLDLASVVLVALVWLYALVSRKLTLSRNLAFSALVLAVTFVLLPRIIFGSAYADMRLVPYGMAVAILAIRFRDTIDYRQATALAVLGCAFFLVRIASNTASLAIAANRQGRMLQALDYVPEGSRVATLVGVPCGGTRWQLMRDTHLGAMVIVRRDGFSNDEWAMEGFNLLDLRYTAAGLYSADPSQMAHPDICHGGFAPWGITRALTFFPRDAFDYLWIIDPPRFDPALTAGLQPVWRGRNTILYKTHL